MKKLVLDFCDQSPLRKYPANVYLVKVNNRSTRKRCEICSELVLKTPDRSQQVNAQPAFTCSKLTIEKLEQGVKYVLIKAITKFLHISCIIYQQVLGQ